MAVIKLKNGNYQARLAGVDGRIRSLVFATKREAQNQDVDWKRAKRFGTLAPAKEQRLNVTDFFHIWFKNVQHENSQSGWRKTQHHYFKRFIEPTIGRYPLKSVTPAVVEQVLLEIRKQGLSAKTECLVYGTLRKVFGDAVENYQFLTFNPVIKKIKPVVPEKEAPHLNLEQACKLLLHVQGKPYGLAVWLQLYLGLRVSELQALTWGDLDLHTKRVSVKRTYVNRTRTLRDYPKGRRQHVKPIPEELLQVLKAQVGPFLPSHFVAPAETQIVTAPFSYRWFNLSLHNYCREVGLPQIGTHGLRHTASAMYLNHGAAKEDMQEFFAHSGMNVTERYIHGWNSKLEKTATLIRLIPNRPKIDQIEVEEVKKEKLGN